MQLWRLAGPASAVEAGRLDTHRPRGACGAFSVWRLANWRPRIADGAVPVWRQSAGEFPLGLGRLVFLFYSGLPLTGWGPPTLWKATCFIHSSLIQMLISSKNTLQVDIYNLPSRLASSLSSCLGLIILKFLTCGYSAEMNCSFFLSQKWASELWFFLTLLPRPNTICLVLVPGLHGQAQPFLRWALGLEDLGFQPSWPSPRLQIWEWSSACALILSAYNFEKEKETLFLRVD